MGAKPKKNGSISYATVSYTHLNGDTVRVAFDPHKVHLFDVETEQTILN